MNLESNYIEVTGIPGSGKTTYIKNNFVGAKVFEDAFPESSSVWSKIFYSIFWSFRILIRQNISVPQLLWLMQKAYSYDESLVNRINAFRHVFLKFAHQYQADNGLIVVDQGISHIPFVLELQDPRDIDRFIELFRSYLSQTKILFIDMPLDLDMLAKRLLARGHKRIDTFQQAVAFVDRNARVATLYKEALQRTHINVTLIKGL